MFSLTQENQNYFEKLTSVAMNNLAQVLRRRMNGTLNLVRVISLVATAAVALSFRMQYAKAHEESKEFASILRITTSFLCGNDEFVEYAKLDPSRCDQRIEFHGEHCWEVVGPLFPGEEFERSDEERNLIETRLSQLFITCVQAEIFVEGMYLDETHEE